MFQKIKPFRNIAKMLLCTVFFTLNACVDENETFTGYLVAKEYTPERICCDGTKTIFYAGFTPRVPVVPANPHHHSKKEAEYYWFIANKNEVIKKSVSSRLFYSKKVGAKVSMKRS